MYESSSSRFGGTIMTLIKDYLIFCIVVLVLIVGLFGVLIYKSSSSKMTNSINWGNGVSYIRRE